TLERVWCHLTDLSGRTLASEGVTAARDTPWQERLTAGLALLDDLLGQAGLDRDSLVGVAIGVPGPLDLQTGVIGPSLPGQAWAGVNVAAEFGRHFDVPLLVENNTRLEAVAEFTWGAGRDIPDVLYLGLSTGIGSGLLVDGNLHHGGARGGGGEIGHLSADSSGDPCPCGNRGCLVQYASLQAVLAKLEPVLGPDAGLDELLASAAEEQPETLRVLREAGEVTGRVLADICNLLNPGRIIVGGELARTGDLILEPIRATLRRTAMPLTRDADVVAAELDLGARAGASGAAALVLRQTDQLVAALLTPERNPSEAV
ncbi:MAG TPA: ROK family protein, partial [Kribbella sp.]|nr:ROK family protein [Kribbella sp.]